MVCFKSRSKLLNAHVVCNDLGCLLLCVETDARFSEYCSSVPYVQTVTAYSRWHRAQGFDSPSRFLRNAAMAGDFSSLVPSPVPLDISQPIASECESQSLSQGTVLPSPIPNSAVVSFSAGASVSSYLAAEVVSSVPAAASLKAHEASTEALKGVKVKQFVRVEGLRDYYILEAADGACRKIATKGNL